MTDREKFEAWARPRWTHPEDFHRRITAPDKYNSYEVQAAWDAWQERSDQPSPSVPECPYPCGWRNLLKHAIEDGAYLARSINEGEPVTENARSVTVRIVMRLRDVLMAINKAAPEAKS